MEVLGSRILLHPRDRGRSTAFYRDVLGLAVHREFPGGTVFVLGGGFLEVSGQSGTLGARRNVDRRSGRAATGDRRGACRSPAAR
jgi:catechol 2,3-dioxygenase-like lactoylglutathione lyase family enzyme